MCYLLGSGAGVLTKNHGDWTPFLPATDWDWTHSLPLVCFPYPALFCRRLRQQCGDIICADMG